MIDSEVCSDCEEPIEFVVGETGMFEDPLVAEEVFSAKFYLACGCTKVRVHFGNISIGGPGHQVPSGWRNE